MNENQSPIIIIGMHRSGTSMLTRFLEESGVFMGIQKNMGLNEEAFFFQKINEWILFQKGATWDNTYNLNFKSDFTDCHITTAVENRINSLFIKDYLGIQRFLKYRSVGNLNTNWGWKDPKNTLTLDIWKNIYPNAKVIHIYRNPIDVAASLRTRELKIEKKFNKSRGVLRKEFFLLKKPCYNQSVRIKTLEEGIKLWEDYTEVALKSERCFKNVLHISYENFLSEPKKTLEVLSGFLKLEINDNIISSIVDKIDPSRMYSFIENDELIKVYKKIKNKKLMQQLNYSNII